jgi:hypothetical protein
MDNFLRYIYFNPNPCIQIREIMPDGNIVLENDIVLDRNNIVLGRYVNGLYIPLVIHKNFKPSDPPPPLTPFTNHHDVLCQKYLYTPSHEEFLELNNLDITHPGVKIANELIS